MTEANKPQPDIFHPYIVIEKFSSAGIVTIYGGSYSCNCMEYKVNGGSPFQSAYNEAYLLALSTQRPLWFKKNFGEYELIYNPNLENK